MTILVNETVDVFCITTRDATIARIDLAIGDLEFGSEGVSKRDPVDEHNSEVAVLLAYGRAFEALGKKLQKRANSLTKHADDIRQYKEKQANKASEAIKVNKAPAPIKSAARKAKVANKK